MHFPRYINAYFKELIDIIFVHGGDVIKFAGDAMQVVWRNRRGSSCSTPMLVIRASRCCLELLENLNNFSPVAGVVLKLHMGVGAGKLSSFCARARRAGPRALPPFPVVHVHVSLLFFPAAGLSR